MAVKTIAELPLITTIADNDLLVIDDGSRNYSIKWGVLKNLITGISSFTADNTAGTISITLSTGAVLTITPHDPTKQDVLTFDTTPTAGSTKPVTSGGIKTALDLKLNNSDYVNFTGATSENAGTAGKVPAPAAGGARYLGSEGAWLTPDSAPTNGSTLLITSDAVYDALLVIVTDIAPVYSSSATYALGAYCTHENTLYKCTTAITTAEAWTAGHWTAVSVGTVLASLESAVATNASDIDAIEDTLEDIDEELDKVVHVDSAQTFTEQEKYQARQNIGAISYNEIEHKRFGVSGVGQSSPTLTRLYDAVGMTATPSTDLVAGSSDFDAYAPFNRRKCVGYWTAGTGKAVFHVQAYEGDADYAEDGTMGDYVAVEVEPFYYYDKDGVMAVSTYPWPGYEIHPVCKDYDGNVRAKTYIPVYALAQDANGKAVSLPGYQNQRGGYNDLRTYATTYNATGIANFAMIEPAAVWHYEWLLQTIEFATTNMQSVINGAVSMRRNANDKITAIPGANKVVLGSYGSNYVVGQTVLLGTYDQNVAVSLYNRITAIEKCDADGTPNASGSYYLITYDGTDRSSSLTANTSQIDSRPWCTGATAGYAPGVAAVKGHTGSPVSNSTGKYPMRYRWRENVYGNQNMTTLDLADLRVSDGNDQYHLDWYFLADPRKYIPFGNYDKATIQNTSKGWVKLGVSTPKENYVSNYVKVLSADTNYPWVKVPTETQSNSAQYYCDYAYLVYSAEVRAVRRGGYVTYGASAGPCYFRANDAVSNAFWSFGATLYFLQ